MDCCKVALKIKTLQKQKSKRYVFACFLFIRTQRTPIIELIPPRPW